METCENCGHWGKIHCLRDNEESTSYYRCLLYIDKEEEKEKTMVRTVVLKKDDDKIHISDCTPQRIYAFYLVNGETRDIWKLQKVHKNYSGGKHTYAFICLNDSNELASDTGAFEDVLRNATNAYDVKEFEDIQDFFTWAELVFYEEKKNEEI